MLKIIKKMWADTEVSQNKVDAYYDYKRRMREQGRNPADVLPPISGRGFLISLASAILLVIVFMAITIICVEKKTGTSKETTKNAQQVTPSS